MKQIQVVDALQDAKHLEELRKLETRMQEEYVEMYGEPDPAPDNDIFTADAVFMLIYDGAPVGFAGARRKSESEGKAGAVYVVPEMRGMRFSTLLLAASEWYVSAVLECQYMMFETGPKQQNAVRLYTQNGYGIIKEGFGYYKDNPGSTFFRKVLR